MCCMRTSKAFRQQQLGSCGSMMVRGKFQYFPQPCRRSSAHLRTEQPLFVALCTPTVDTVPSCHSHLRPSFGSLHSLDMTFIQLSDRSVIKKMAVTKRRLHELLADDACLPLRVFYLLGYAAEELVGRSWYSLIHPEDLFSGAEWHRRLRKSQSTVPVPTNLKK